MLRHGSCVEIDTWNMLNTLHHRMCVEEVGWGRVGGGRATTLMDTVNAYNARRAVNMLRDGMCVNMSLHHGTCIERERQMHGTT